MRRFGGTVGGLALAVVAVVAPATAQAQEAVRTCNGKPVTIAFDDPGVGLNINGTNGPDVILGGPGPETIRGGLGADVICGGEGDDVLDGQGGRDKLFGQGGSDVFKGAGLGQDLVTGGSREFDVARYADSGVGVSVDETAGVVHMTGAPVNGGILGIELVTGSPFDDILVGRSGADTLNGGGGNDTIDPRGGSNDLDGGTGRDTVTYATASERQNVNLANGLTVRGTSEDQISGFEVVVGSPLGDRLTGTSSADELRGGGGDDTVKVKGGDDILDGGGGDDVLFPGGGDDDVSGGANDPVTSSGEHGDLVSYQGDTLDQGATHLEVVLYYFAPTNNPPYVSGVGEDSLTGVESARGVKNRQNTFSGTDGPNVLIGGDGIDSMSGRGGNDLMYGLGGTDTINGDYPGGQSPEIFGDDYLDGGAPNGPGDPDRVHGNGGNDTCTGAIDDGDGDHLVGCETVF